jgi:hypothetical protein
LRGSLHEFNIGDILQLYQISGRTGSVRVWQSDSPVYTIYIDRGRISGAGADNWNLINEIRRIEWLSQEVKQQLDLIEREGGGAGLSLIVRALLSPQAWEYFSERQLEQLVFPVLNWQEGEFEAQVDVIPRVAPLRVNQSPQQLVLSAARWEEEVRGAETEGFSLEIIWERTGNSPDAVPNGSEIPPQVITLLDLPRSIDDLSAAAGISVLRVIDQIRQLKQSGLVRQRDSS